LLVDFAVGRPTLTVAQAARALGSGNAGAEKLIDSLVTHGILAPCDERVYGRRLTFLGSDTSELLAEAGRRQSTKPGLAADRRAPE
jgi:hypothetical protein